MSRQPERGKAQDETPLEYYQAKHQSGEVKETKKKNQKPLKSSSAPDESFRFTSDGYVPLDNASTEKEREFERYQEITFAQKASDKAKRNPMIPSVLLRLSPEEILFLMGRIGMLATLAALTLGLRAMSRGDRLQSQMMMR